MVEMRCLVPGCLAKVQADLNAAQRELLDDAFAMARSGDPAEEQGGWALYWAVAEEAGVLCYAHEESHRHLAHQAVRA